MDCNSIQNIFSAVADNELDQETTASFQIHIGKCKACAHEWHRFQTTLLSLRSIDLEQAPPDLLEKVNQKIHRRHPLLRFLQWLQHANPTFSLPTATATVAVAFAAMLLYKNIIDSNQPLFANSPTSPIANSFNQSSNPAILTSTEKHSPQKVFAFRQDLLQSTDIQFEQSFKYDGETHQIFFPNQKNNPETDVFFNSYIHRYLKPNFVPNLHSQLLITIHPQDQDSLLKLHRSLFSEKKWQVKALGQNLYLLTLNRAELNNLKELLAGHSVVPPLPQTLAGHPEEKTIKVAIRLK